MKPNALTAAAAAAALLLSACSRPEATQQAPAPEIATLTVSAADTRVDHQYPATIKGKTDIDIRPQVTGFITKVHVDEGQSVKKGQTLFTLDQVQYQAAVDQAQASVATAQTALETAALTADNKRRLLDKNIISQYEYQLADNQLQQARAALQQARAALVNAQKNLAYTLVTAPCDGVVGSIPNREGSLASPSSAQPLTTVSDNSQVYAYFSLTERDILTLLGDGSRTLSQAIAAMPAVTLRLADGTDYPIEGKIATVSGIVNQGTGASNVRALFANPTGLLRSGSTGNITIPTYADSVITIPQRATYEVQDRRYVYLLNDSNRVASTYVTVQDLNDGQNFIVTSGLRPGDRIAIEGIGTTVKDGIEIRPKQTTAQ